MKSNFVFAGYEDDIFEVSSNLHFQESKFGGNIYQFGGKKRKKQLTLRGSWSLFFFQV